MRACISFNHSKKVRPRVQTPAPKIPEPSNFKIDFDTARLARTSLLASYTTHNNMEAPASSQSQQTHNSSRQSRGNRHRPRRGRGDSTNQVSDAPTSLDPQQQQPSSGSRGRGRGRGGRATQNRTVNGRQFGGQLTRQDTNNSQASSAPTQLQPDAAVFTPGQGTSSKKPPSGQARQQKRRFSKSQAPDIATRTHEDIDHGHYECPICTSEVQRNSKVWSCHTCWTVFHLACIKKWASNQGSSAAQPQEQNGELDHPRQWRCPGCNLPKDEIPKIYSCWCGKEIDPKPVAGLPPHSCGNTCGKERARKCPHPCPLQCHAGPCPPCDRMGPTQVCFCGKHEVTKRCCDTDYDTGWSCGEICGEVMLCGEHECPRSCHEGLCGACKIRVPARCYCGHVEKDVICDDRGEEKESSVTHPSNDEQPVVEHWTGSFNCDNVCDRLFDCGEHHCEQECHVQSAQPEHCPRSPHIVTSCPCGKTPLTELTTETRTNCTDPIPHCQEQCGKTLPCGHADEQICHSGNCSACMNTVEIKCRCGRTTSKTICHQGTEEKPQCARTCKTLLNCGRHACDERCCPGERKAVERQSTKRKQRPLGSAPRQLDDMFEPEHICTQECGRPLKCGQHYCNELCHKGPCGTCREAIFEEVSCACGRTVLQPPLPCGTKSPPCRYPCTRPKPCGHPVVPHNCHQDDETCPKCPFLMEKRCMCGKKTLKNQQCWLQEVRCGQVCGRKLKCGSHYCLKTCHLPGECEDAHGKPCQQPCGKEKKVCGHPDIENTCHAPFPCKEDKPCQSKIFITCDCQAQKQEMKCGASKTGGGNNGKTLPCNDECARLERNRKLALALNIDQSTHADGGDHIPYSADTLNIFAEDTKWAQAQEREFRVFASSLDEKRLRFKPMQSRQRAFIHALAEDFGFDSESMDPEPHRHVMIWKTPRFVSAPNKTIAEAQRIRMTQKAGTISANVSDNEGAAKKIKAARPSAEPYNGFVISNPRFGLTVDELKAELNSLVHASMPFTFDIEFLPSEEVVLKAVSRTLPPPDLQQMLENIKTQLIAALKSKGCGTAELCTTDNSLNILRREAESTAAADGWSKVAARRAAPKTTISGPTATGGANTFDALTSNKITFTKKTTEKPKPKPKPELVVDDWEAAENALEEQERIASGESADEAPARRSLDTDHASEAVGSDAAAGTDSTAMRSWADEVTTAEP